MTENISGSEILGSCTRLVVHSRRERRLVVSGFHGDITPAVLNGQPVIDCSVRSDSLDIAIAQVVQELQRYELHVKRIEIEPSGLARAA
ncbi:MAG: hypothetical protein J4G05_09535 [Chlorobi bacterium]|nr:hypothetical protein [Chlorobiota bacterium]